MRILSLAVSLFLNSVSAHAASPTGPDMSASAKDQDHVTFTRPCKTVRDNGTELNLTPPFCDYFMGKNIDAEFNALSGPEQVRMIQSMTADFKKASDEYFQKSDMLLNGTDPEKVTAGKTPQQRAKVLLDLKSQVVKHGAEISKPFCSHPFKERHASWERPFAHRLEILDREIASQKRLAGIEDKKRIEKMEQVWQRQTPDSSAFALKKISSSLKGKDVLNLQKDLDTRFDGSKPGDGKGTRGTEEEMTKLFGAKTTGDKPAPGQLRDTTAAAQTYAKDTKAPPEPKYQEAGAGLVGASALAGGAGQGAAGVGLGSGAAGSLAIGAMAVPVGIAAAGAGLLLGYGRYRQYKEEKYADASTLEAKQLGSVSDEYVQLRKAGNSHDQIAAKWRSQEVESVQTDANSANQTAAFMRQQEGTDTVSAEKKAAQEAFLKRMQQVKDKNP